MPTLLEDIQAYGIIEETHCESSLNNGETIFDFKETRNFPLLEMCQKVLYEIRSVSAQEGKTSRVAIPVFRMSEKVAIKICFAISHRKNS